MINDIDYFFDNNFSEYGKFDHIPNERRLSSRPDLNAFMLLNSLVPGDSHMVAGAEHDELYLDIDVGQLLSATEEQLLDLMRCGIVLNREGLTLFVSLTDRQYCATI